MERLKLLWEKTSRKKKLTNLLDTRLKRCLNTFDLTLFGTGQMIGAGIYVVTGSVVRNVAGPAAVLSYAVAGFAAMLSALCYAEFGARVPLAGSAYAYTYVTIGEFWAFLIGWNIVLEHLIGVASVARAWSGTFDTLFDGGISNATIKHIGRLGEDSEWIAEYPDLIGPIVVVCVSILVAIGAKISVSFNSGCTIINGAVMLIIVIGGFYLADTMNFQESGFFPFGVNGVINGAAVCFYAFIGFEGIAIAGEEAKTPEKSIPIATIVSIVIVTSIYLLATLALSLITPYDAVNTSAAFPAAFSYNGVDWLKYIVAGGSLFGITASLVGTAFSLSRAVYAMANDGVFFKIFANVHSKTRTPVVSIVVFNLLAAIVAMLVDIEALVEFMSIGTLTAFTIVAANVIVLRYLPVSKCQFELKSDLSKSSSPSENTNTDSDKASIVTRQKSHDDFGKLKDKFKWLPVLNSFAPGNAVSLSVSWLAVSVLGFSSSVTFGQDLILEGVWWIFILIFVATASMISSLLVIVAHERNDAFVTFQIPLVPSVPALSMFCNLTLMLQLSYVTWLRHLIWLAVGFIIYFAYGIRHSDENRPLGDANSVSYVVENKDKSQTSNHVSMDIDNQEQSPETQIPQ